MIGRASVGPSLGARSHPQSTPNPSPSLEIVLQDGHVGAFDFALKAALHKVSVNIMTSVIHVIRAIA